MDRSTTIWKDVKLYVWAPDNADPYLGAVSTH